MEENKLSIFMEHTIHHNEHHAEDFITIAKDLRDAGADDAAELAESAAKDLEDAIHKLQKAKELYEANFS